MEVAIAMAVTALLSTYVVRVQVMRRQAPITAAIVIAAGLTHHSKMTALEVGVRRVGEVLLGCVVALVISWLLSRLAGYCAYFVDLSPSQQAEIIARTEESVG